MTDVRPLCPLCLQRCYVPREDGTKLDGVRGRPEKSSSIVYFVELMPLTRFKTRRRNDLLAEDLWMYSY